MPVPVFSLLRLCHPHPEEKHLSYASPAAGDRLTDIGKGVAAEVRSLQSRDWTHLLAKMAGHSHPPQARGLEITSPGSHSSRCEKLAQKLKNRAGSSRTWRLFGDMIRSARMVTPLFPPSPASIVGNCFLHILQAS